MKGEVKLMAEKINAGTILIKEGTLLPKGLQLESDPYSKGWRLVKSPGSPGIDRKLCEAGWTFFYMAGEVDAMAFGSESDKTTHRAVKKAIAKIKLEKFNCLEISQVAARHFLGLPYVTVAAHPRHIQESIFLFHAKHISEWDRARLAAI
jgi:hypothetical protein